MFKKLKWWNLELRKQWAQKEKNMQKEKDKKTEKQTISWTMARIISSSVFYVTLMFSLSQVYFEPLTFLLTTLMSFSDQ